MKIVFDESTLEQGQNASRSITGVLYFDLDGFEFPMPSWSDFVVVISLWWLESIAKLEHGIEDEVNLMFMDGPYWINVTREAEDLVRVRCMEDRSDASAVHEQYLAMRDLAKQIRRAARLITVACGQRGMRSRDLDALAGQLTN
jgi:hypothetical protein